MGMDSNSGMQDESCTMPRRSVCACPASYQNQSCACWSERVRIESRLPAEQRHLRPFFPNVTCASQPGAICGSAIFGIAFVARRALRDEELVYDYRMSPHLPRPTWYTPVDAAAEARRWS